MRIWSSRLECPSTSSDLGLSFCTAFRRNFPTNAHFEGHKTLNLDTVCVCLFIWWILVVRQWVRHLQSRAWNTRSEEAVRLKKASVPSGAVQIVLCCHANNALECSGAVRVYVCEWARGKHAWRKEQLDMWSLLEKCRKWPLTFSSAAFHIVFCVSVRFNFSVSPCLGVWCETNSCGLFGSDKDVIYF